MIVTVVSALGESQNPTEVQLERLGAQQQALLAPFVANKESSLLHRQALLAAEMGCAVETARGQVGKELYATTPPISAHGLLFLKTMNRAYIVAKDAYDRKCTELLRNAAPDHPHSDRLTTEEIDYLRYTDTYVPGRPVAVRSKRSQD